MTPEELEALRLYIEQMQSDPMARATNDYGQGAGFLQLDEQPESWDRLGEKNDLYTDLFKTTQTYLKDFVPGLYPEVEDPGQFEGYRSDKADLYRGNPAYDEVSLAMADGASFEEAVAAVAASPDFAANLPKTERGDVDRIAFRNSAETYVSERAREGREFDEFDAERQAYDDYVRPRTGEDFAPNRTAPEDIQQFLKPTNLQESFADGGPLMFMGRQLHPGIGTPDAAQAQGVPDSQRRSVLSTANTRMGRPIGDPVMVPPSPTRNAAGRGKAKSTSSQAPARSAANRNAANKSYNDTFSRTYENAQKIKAKQSAPSKKQQNLSQLVRAYNQLMYGE